MPSPVVLRQPKFFDYPSVAREAGVSPADLAVIESQTRADYPNDQMMFELRMLRTCQSILDGFATVRQAITPDSKVPPASAA